LKENLKYNSHTRNLAIVHRIKFCHGTISRIRNFVLFAKEQYDGE